LAAYFFDSSALAKLYHPEVGTPTVDLIIETAENKIRISRLTVVELPSVFAIKVRTQSVASSVLSIPLQFNFFLPQNQLLPGDCLLQTPATFKTGESRAGHALSISPN
jgi:hypothetical protein